MIIILLYKFIQFLLKWLNIVKIELSCNLLLLFACIASKLRWRIVATGFCHLWLPCKCNNNLENCRWEFVKECYIVSLVGKISKLQIVPVESCVRELWNPFAQYNQSGGAWYCRVFDIMEMAEYVIIYVAMSCWMYCDKFVQVVVVAACPIGHRMGLPAVAWPSMGKGDCPPRVYGCI